GPRATDRDSLPDAARRVLRRSRVRGGAQSRAVVLAGDGRTAHRRRPARIARLLRGNGASPRTVARSGRGYPNGFGVTGARPGTWNTRRSSSLTAVSVPPQRQPESSIRRLGASCSSSVDQWPQTTVTSADLRRSCSNQGRKPAGAIRGPRFSLNSITPWSVQKRMRV